MPEYKIRYWIVVRDDGLNDGKGTPLSQEYYNEDEARKTALELSRNSGSLHVLLPRERTWDGTSAYMRAMQNLRKKGCPDCRGLGYQDDASPGDIYVNSWICKTCRGTGFDPKQDLENVLIATLQAIREGKEVPKCPGVHNFLPITEAQAEFFGTRPVIARCIKCAQAMQVPANTLPVKGRWY